MYPCKGLRARHEAFKRLKEAFSMDPILRHPDPQAPFVVEVDASKHPNSNHLHLPSLIKPAISPHSTLFQAVQSTVHYPELSLIPYLLLTCSLLTSRSSLVSANPISSDPVLPWTPTSEIPAITKSPELSLSFRTHLPSVSLLSELPINPSVLHSYLMSHPWTVTVV